MARGSGHKITVCSQRPVRTGAETFIAGTASCRIMTEGVDDLYAELRSQGVLHPVSQDGVDESDFGTRESATLDLDRRARAPSPEPSACRLAKG